MLYSEFIPETLQVEKTFDVEFSACSNASIKLDLLKEYVIWVNSRAIHQEVSFGKDQLEKYLQWTFNTGLDNYKCKRIVLECAHVMRVLQKKAKESEFSYKLPLKPAVECLNRILEGVNKYASHVDVETTRALLKMILRASGHYDSDYFVQFPGDEYEAMCLVMIKAALLGNKCPKWIYDERADLLPNSRTLNLLAIYCLKRLTPDVVGNIDWGSLFNRFSAVLKLPRDKAQIPGIVPRSLPCKYDDVASGIIDDQLKPCRILGRLAVNAEESFVEYFFASAVVFCHPSSSGEYSEGLVEFTNAYIIESFKRKRSISGNILKLIRELLENALQLKKPYVVKLAAKSFRAFLHFASEADFERILHDIIQSLIVIDEPTRLYSRLELLANVMRNFVDKNLDGLDDTMMQVSTLLDVNDPVKTALAIDCSLAYVLMVQPEKLEFFMVGLLENAWDYLVLVSEADESLSPNGVDDMLHPLFSIGVRRMKSREFIAELILGKLQDVHCKSKGLARLIELCTHKICKEFRLNVLGRSLKEMKRFDGQTNIKESALKRLEFLLTLFSHSIQDTSDIVECQKEMIEVIQEASQQSSPLIAMLVGQCFIDTFTQALPVKFYSVAKETIVSPIQAAPKLKCISKESHLSLFDLFNSMSIGHETKTQLTVWKGIVQAWLIVCCSAKIWGGTWKALTGMEKALQFQEQDNADVLESRVSIINHLFTFRYMSVQEINNWTFGLRMYAHFFTQYPSDNCLPPEIHCRRLEYACMARLFYSSIYTELQDIATLALPFILCGYELISGHAVRICGALLHFHPRRFMVDFFVMQDVFKRSKDERAIRGILFFLERTEFLQRIFYYCEEQVVIEMLNSMVELEVQNTGNGLNVYLNICRSFLNGWGCFNYVPATAHNFESGGTIIKKYAALCFSMAFPVQKPADYAVWMSKFLTEESFGMNFIALDCINRCSLVIEISDEVLQRVFEMRCRRNEEDSRFDVNYAVLYQKVGKVLMVDIVGKKKSEMVAVLEICIARMFDKVLKLVEDLGYDGMDSLIAAMNFFNKYLEKSKYIIVELIKERLESRSGLNEQKKVILMTCYYTLLLPDYEKLKVDLDLSSIMKNGESEVMQNALGMVLALAEKDMKELELKLLLPVLSFKSTHYRKMCCYELLENNLKALVGGCHSKEESMAQKCRLTLDFMFTRVLSKNTFLRISEYVINSMIAFSAQQKKIALGCLRKLVRRNYLLLQTELYEKLKAMCVRMLNQPNCSEAVVLEEAFELLSACIFFKFPHEKPDVKEPIIALALIQASGYRFPEWLPECFERAGLVKQKNLRQRILLRWRQLHQSTWEEERFKLTEEQLQVFHELAPSYII